ncbi:parathyroid hormone receptor, putative [Pediculus humanus corporis]|uniref:Parathyroid hormone receptor, putative n=1 Tax=Pediculus humanus subsp. corporis TaxID=121224 RepID=E0VIW3_PEDHC|nr:parathyroid hormone receptor, putative [Pediculus humanus corporis]EEB13319.1 parathyroid hormone receptor, putative [Pediculus humanus corporis]
MKGIALSAEELEAVLQLEKLKCEKLAQNDNEKGTCKTIWDGIMCWSWAYPNQILTQQCPSYIAGFDQTSNATKLCTENGTWYVSPKTNQEWTNYNQCFIDHKTTIFVQVSSIDSFLLKEYLPILKGISHIGYGISLISLVMASLILLSFRKLYCSRNTLHLHLFVSFIMRAFVTFLKEFLFEQGIGLRSNFVEQNGTKYFLDEINSNWECKSLTTIWQYFIMANYSWILMEGLYMHNLLMFALFSDNANIFMYIILGWGLPIIFVISWALVRINLENDLCWTTNLISRNFLIIRIPIIISVLVNFGLFLNIIRLLLLKVKSAVQEETQKYWRLAKSTIVLAPLFGVHYTIFLGMSYCVGINETIELIWLFCDQLFASFQGFFVALFFCFLNNEVQTEMKKKLRQLLYGCD